MAHVQKRTLPSGLVRWQATYTDAAGKRRAPIFKRRSDADAFLVKVRRDLQLGTHVPSSDSPTIAQACAEYLAHCRGRLDRGERMTRKNVKLYEGHVANHILSEAYGIGAVRAGKLVKSQIGDFRDRMRTAGVSVLTTRKVLGTLSRALDHQIAADRLAVNHARNVKVIGTRDEKTKRVIVPSKQAIRELLEAAGERMYPRLIFAAFTGARAGEQWAARWMHVDFTTRELLIESRVDAWGDEDVTKSEAGMRTVPLGAALISELKAWKLRSPHSKDEDLIFPNTEGGHVHHTNFLKREWHPLLRAVGVKRFKWHHLRHFAASCWIEAGLQPKTVQTFIGHATLAMTMDTYGHLFKSDDHQQAMDNIAGELLR